MNRMLSGHPEQMELPPAPRPNGPWVVAAAATNTAWFGPWGMSFTANLMSRIAVMEPPMVGVMEPVSG
jgi:hypothetical protein